MTQFAADVFAAQARMRGTATALEFESVSITYAQLEERSTQVALALRAGGAGPGARVAVLARNCAAFFAIFGGVCKSRTCLVPLNFRLSAAEIRFILMDVTAKFLFTSKEFVPLALEAIEGLPQHPTLVTIDESLPYLLAFDSWLGTASDSGPLSPSQPQEDILLLYTSGTTGLSKGVRISNYNYRAMLSAFPAVPGFSYRVGEVVASTMPLFHVAGINAGMSALAQGCKVLPVAHFVPAEFLALLRERGVNGAFLAPAMINALLHTGAPTKAEAPELRMIAYGAAPISREVLNAAKQRFGCDFAQLYGLTESSGAGTVLSPEAHMQPAKQGSCGVAWPGMQLRVIDSDGNPVAPGTVGEILLAGDFITPGYRGAEVTGAVAVREGWLHTGDAGYLDEEGYLFIRDRLKDLIVSGGENVSPAEVENAIFGCPGVADVAVIGVPSDKWGEEVKAVVVAATGAAPTAADIIAWTKARIAAYKVPKSVDFLPALPRNAAGKVLRRELRQPYWVGSERGIN